MPGFYHPYGCLPKCEIELILVLSQVIAFHRYIYSVTNHLLIAYLVNNIIRYANDNSTMNINDTCYHFFSLSFANLEKIKKKPFTGKKLHWLYFSIFFYYFWECNIIISFYPPSPPSKLFHIPLFVLFQIHDLSFFLIVVTYIYVYAHIFST